MAYARRRFSTRRRVTRRPRRSYRSRPRRNTYRRPTRTRRTSKRYISNVASRKQSDKLNSYTDIVDNVSTGTFNDGSATFTGATGQVQTVLWMPTGRDAENSVENKMLPLTLGRQRSTVFLRGFKEVVQINTNSQSPWQWRRVVFSLKQNYFADSTDPSIGQWYRRNNDGYKRLVAAAPLASLYGVLFRGADQTDWIDPMIAQIDTNRITLHYDKSMHLNPGSSGGLMRTYKLWHGFNKNLKYDDIEDGAQFGTSPFAQSGKYGLGNVYVVDMFKESFGSENTDALEFKPSCQYYWHEK